MRRRRMKSVGIRNVENGAYGWRNGLCRKRGVLGGNVRSVEIEECTNAVWVKNHQRTNLDSVENFVLIQNVEW